MKEIFPANVTANKEIAPGAFLLSFPRNFSFTAGQVIGITLSKGEEPRLYSIASGENQDEVWILYTIKPDGALTPQLAQAKPGDTVYITKPFGNFICREEKAVWIATGTGIAPFASMFFQGSIKTKLLSRETAQETDCIFLSNLSNRWETITTYAAAEKNIRVVFLAGLLTT
jgi:ferredoxin/flavodoxin---NADP+ reductase